MCGESLSSIVINELKRKNYNSAIVKTWMSSSKFYDRTVRDRKVETPKAGLR